jgi:RHS repeat-associated protein
MIDPDPWGGETGRSSNQAFQPHRYTSYERDANGGDDAMMRRYQSAQSRFSQPDPYDGSYNLTDPQSLNRYAYVQNDPVNFIDPSGLDLEGQFANDPDGMNPVGYSDGGASGSETAGCSSATQETKSRNQFSVGSAICTPTRAVP